MRTPLFLAALCAVPGCASAPPPPPVKPAAPADYKLLEARNYIEYFKTADTRQWEHAKERLVRLGPSVIPVLFTAMQEYAGEVDFNCQDVLKRMGPDALPSVLDEIRKGDAGCSGGALTRRRRFRGGLIAVMGEAGAPGAAAGLAKVLSEDAWPGARRKAAFYLGRLKDPMAVPALIEAMRKEPEEEVREEARSALRRIAGRDLGPHADTWELWSKSGPSSP